MERPDTDDVSTLTQILEEVRAGRMAVAATEKRVAHLADALEAWMARLDPRGDTASHDSAEVAGARDDRSIGGPTGSNPLVSRRAVEQRPNPGRSSVPSLRSEDDVDYLKLISHDLKEPLRGIAYFSQLIEEDYGDKLGQEGLDYLGYIKAAARRMGMLLADGALLSHLKYDPLEPQPTDLEAQVNALIDEFQDEIDAKQGTIIRQGAFPVLYCDTLAINELLRRLIKNAVQYSVVPAEIRIMVDGPRRGVYTFTVQDRGIGIEPEYLDKVFDLFYRLHSWEAFEGTGAGLTICKRIVEAHGGRIWIESTAGAGTTVRFTLADTTDIVERLSAE